MKKDRLLIILIVILSLALGVTRGILYSNLKNNDSGTINNNVNHEIGKEVTISSIKYKSRKIINNGSVEDKEYDISCQYFDKINDIMLSSVEIVTTTGVGICDEIKILYSDDSAKTIMLLGGNTIVYNDSNKTYKYNSVEDLKQYVTEFINK